MTRKRNLSRGRTSVRAVVATLTLTVILGGCQGIPTAGTVYQGLNPLTQSEQDVQYQPSKPMPDATREMIVRGFIQAASSATNDYEIARQFLTRDYYTQWDPSMSVTVDEGSRDYSETEGDVASIRISASAIIDERGMLTQVASDERTTLTFELEQEDGEWRIASAPNGVILDRTTFLDVWSPHQLFFNVPGETLVPDTRWFLNRATMSTNIVNQLLAGPTAGLTGVAVSAFPAGTRLATEAVLIDAGIARIDLSSEFETITPEALELVEQQLAASLYSVPEVSHFVITVGGVELLSGSVSLEHTATSDVAETGTVVGVVLDGAFGFLRASGVEESPDFSARVTEIDPTGIVMDREGRGLATLSEAGVHWVSGSDQVLIDSRAKLIEPTIDRDGYVWLFSTADQGFFTAWHPSREAVQVTTPELAQERIVAARISPDGNRIAILVNDEGLSKVIVTGIVRGRMGEPDHLVELSNPIVSYAPGVPIDFDWVDAQRIAVLSKGEGDQTRFTVTGPGLFAETRAGVQGAVALRGGGRLPVTYLQTATGDVSTPQGTSGWQRQAQNIEVLSKRG